MSERTPDLVIVGSLGLDDLETPYGSVSNIMGGSASYASVSAHFICQPGIVAVAGDDFPSEYEENLTSRGIDVSGLQREPGKTFHWKGRYEGDMGSAITLDTQLGVFENFKPVLPQHYRDARCLFLGNIHPQLQLDVLDSMNYSSTEGGPIVGADSMNLWIDISRDLLLKVIERVNIMLLNDGEVRMLTGKTQLLDAGRAIQEMGPETVVIKKGEHGAMILCGEEIILIPAMPLSTATDPTGAGDTFAGGLMGYVAKMKNTSRDTLFEGAVLGTVHASHVVESFGLGGALNMTSADARARIETLHKMSSFNLEQFDFLS